MKNLLMAVVLLGLGMFASAQIDGNANSGVLVNDAHNAMAADKKVVYESKEFAVGVVVNYDVKAGQSAFVLVPRAHNIVIRTSADITVRFNSAANDAVSISAAEGQLAWTHIEVTNIFITAPAGASIKIFLS
jgi:hypothetical protein